ncbi:hypothetical protein COP2_001227 [Malus domestica]|uniref:Uncharacterized protein n=1 Tax=Malus domestica TaxID=3750 RepID=A0A498KVT4_MALDO|nr:hypothetical protein DVH24_023187 [Malus domestica]
MVASFLPTIPVPQPRPTSMLLLRGHYSSASLLQQKLYYDVVFRVATMSKTRYTYLGFWAAGLALFQLAHSLVFDSSYNPTFLLASMRHDRLFIRNAPRSCCLLQIKDICLRGISRWIWSLHSRSSWCNRIY